MSAITIENDLVHYEVLGRGRPVIFVHGWLGSWRYWVPTMQQLSVKYRTYALDLWGFGDSGKESNKYGLKEQVKLLYDFMDKLGIGKAALVGHSLGAAIALRFAAQYPDRAPRVMLVSPPLFDLGGLDDNPQPAKSAIVTPSVTIAAVPAATGAVSVSNTTSSAPAPVPAVVPAPAPVPAMPNNAAAPAPASASATPQPATPTTPANPGTPAPAPANGPASAAPTASGTAQPTNPPTPAPASDAPPSAATNVPTAPTPAPSGSSMDTIPRNPFKGLGDTPEEILARLQAKNILNSAGLGDPATTPSATPVKNTGPLLPTSIGTPVKQPSTPATGAPATGSGITPAKTDMANPLLSILTGINPSLLLTKHVDKDAPDVDKLRAEVEKTDETAITRSAQSFNGINLSVDLQRLSSPTLVLHGKNDSLLPPPSDELLRRIMRGKPEGHLLAFVEPDLRHFPMLEITAKFNRLLMDFLEVQDLTNVQFKDQWQRTMR